MQNTAIVCCSTNHTMVGATPPLSKRGGKHIIMPDPATKFHPGELIDLLGKDKEKCMIRQEMQRV